MCLGGGHRPNVRVPATRVLTSSQTIVTPTCNVLQPPQRMVPAYRVHHIGIGRGYAGTQILVLIDDLPIQVLTTDGNYSEDANSARPRTTNHRPKRERGPSDSCARCPETTQWYAGGTSSGTPGGIRTHMTVRSPDFESGASDQLRHGG